MDINEVSPPGFGATKGDDKGGTAAAFDRARKEGRFKGSKSDMFAIMWSQKNKGDKPHYKPGTDKKYKKYQEGMENAPSIDEKLDDLLSDPLQGLYDLYEAEMNVMPKPDIQDMSPSSYASPNQGVDYHHPVTKRKRDIDDQIRQGQDPISAHQAIHGEVNTGDPKSKGEFAATLGRLQDQGNRGAVKLQPEKGSILSREAQKDAEMDQVTHDDLRTPMNKQVPDREQTPADQVAEELQECYNYMDDVKYLQTYGRA